MPEYAERGDAIMMITANDPDLLADQDPDLVSAASGAAWRHFGPVFNLLSRGATNWLAIAAARPAWAAKVFPDLPKAAQEPRLWQAIFKACRLDRPDPVVGWQEHIGSLSARCDYLNHRRYDALRFKGPGTNLSVGLPKGHIWRSGRLITQKGIPYIANLPTEEVFSLPDRCRIEGVVATSKPLLHRGTLIEDFRLTFAGGRVVKVAAKKGEPILRKLLETDDGASRPGEVALVPHSSPISRSGLLFFNGLIDENAASHLASGHAYRFSMQNGEAMSSPESAPAGGNDSQIHVDFMIGSGEIGVDGITQEGAAEPVMRDGEWTLPI